MSEVGSRRDSRRRHEEAAFLRACGHSWASIAEHLGYRSRSGAQSAVERLYRRTTESPDAKRRSLAEGLMVVKANLFETLAEAKSRGDTDSMVSVSRELRQVTDQLGKLDGLHTHRVEVTQNHQIAVTIAELRQQFHAAIDAEVVAELE
jgi:hypothetical protein